MSRYLRVLALALGIPLLGLAVVTVANGKLEGDWLNSLIAEVGPQPPEIIERARLSALCGTSIASELPDICFLSGLARGMQVVGVAAVAVTAILLLSLLPLRLGATRNPRVLVFFRLALTLFLLGLTAMVVLDGAVVAGAAYVGEAVFTGSVHPFVVFGVGAAVAVAAFGVIRAIVTMGRISPIKAKAIVLERERDARLFEVVDELAKRGGTAPPDQILAGLEPNFYVTEAPVAAFDGTYTGRTLHLSVPLTRIFDKDELRAVIGHELGHFIGEDTVYSRRFYPVYRASLESLGVLQASARGWNGIPLLAPLGVLALFFEAFAIRARGQSRERELAADAVGAKLVSTEAIGVALVKLEAYMPSWQSSYDEAASAIRGQRSAGNLSARFQELAALNARGSVVSDIDHGRIPHPTDSHPATSERLRRLGLDPATTIARATTVPPADPAFAFIDDGEALELDLMDDLVDDLGPATDADDATAEAPVDPSAVIREAAESDPELHAAIALFERVRGHDLQLPLWAGGWVTLADLDIRPHLESRGFAPFVSAEELPAGDQALAVGVASATTPASMRVRAGTPLKLVGMGGGPHSLPPDTELIFDLGGRLVAIRTVGEWPIQHQVAGLLVAPASDILAGSDSHLREELEGVVAGLVAWRDRLQPATGDGAVE